MISRIDVTGIKEVNNYLDAIRKKLINPDAEMKSTASYIEKTIIPKRFYEQKNPLGQPWKPSQRVIRYGGRTLSKSNDSDALRFSIRSIITTGSKGLEINFRAEGKAADYAAVHNNGMRIRNRGGRYTQMPKRQFAYLTEQEKQYIIREIWIKGLMAA